MIYNNKYCHVLYNNKEKWQNGVISQPDLPTALWVATLQVKNEKATWLELTWDFEGTATLLSEKHMCKKGNRNLTGGGGSLWHKQRKSHVYSVETMLKPFVRFLRAVSKNNQLLMR